VHDHTSILATIERKWNLPAMTHRDANATTLMDFLSSDVTFPQPPRLAAPSDPVASERSCSFDQPQFTVHHRRPR
jgi:phospholipase C